MKAAGAHFTKWHSSTYVIPALRRGRQKEQEFKIALSYIKAILRYIVRPSSPPPLL